MTGYQPFKERYRCILPHLYQKVKNYLHEMLNVGAVRKGFCSWSSAVVLVRKKDGSFKIFIDLWKLNSLTIMDSYALPRIETHLIVWMEPFSFNFEFKSGYWQLELEEEAKAFICIYSRNFGVLEIWKNTSWTHQCSNNLPVAYGILPLWFTSDIVYHLFRWHHCFQPEEHVTWFDAVFDKLRTARLKCKPSKCELFRKQMNYLGHVARSFNRS